MLKTRIFVVGVQRMTGELIRQAYEDQPDTLVEGVLTRRLPLVTVAEEHRPDLLITAVGGDAESELDQVLDRCPKMVILAVEADGQRSFLYRLKPDKEKLGELSREALLKAARRVIPGVP